MEYLMLVVFGIVVIGVMWYIGIYNGIKRNSIKIEEAFANIDVALSKRYQVLTKLFEVAKGYAKHERETLMAVVNIRQGMPLSEKESAYQKIESGYSRINLLAESYPKLKADKLFLNLQDAVVDTEEHLSAARRLYNANVSYYNQSIETFPGNKIAESMNVTRASMLKFDEKELGNVDLSM